MPQFRRRRFLSRFPLFLLNWSSNGEKNSCQTALFFFLAIAFFSLFGKITACDSDGVGPHGHVHTQHTHMCSTQNGVWLFLNYLNSLWKRGPFVGFLWDCPWKAPIVWRALWYNASAFNRFNGTRGYGSQDPVQEVACFYLVGLLFWSVAADWSCFSFILIGECFGFFFTFGEAISRHINPLHLSGVRSQSWM